MADPQSNPNALGAPTEGFGQTVSFAFDPRGVTPSLQLAHSQPRGAGVSGVSRGQLANPNEAFQPVAQDGTAEFLMKLGKEILAPKIEEQRNAAFVEGIQRSMNGEAIKDMAEKQPWYSRIFGDTPMMEGARAYEVSAKVNEVVAQQTANMETLKTLGPKDAAKHFAGVIQQSLTGDASTDALVSKHLIDAMPSLMKAQAKSYYGYGQKRAMDALSTNMSTAATALQQAGQQHSEDYIDDKDMAVRKQAFVRSILPPDGINEENYAKVMAANLRGAADKGQFHAIEAVRQSGGFAAMTEEQRNTVEAAINAAAVKHRDRYAFQYVKEIAELRSDAAHPPEGMTPHMIADRYTKMNTAYMKLTGSPVGLFTSDEMASGTMGTINAIKAEEVKATNRAAVIADKTATADAKQAAQLEQAQAVSSAIVRGDVLLAKKMTKATDDEIDLEFMRQFQSNPEAGTFLVRQNFIKSGGYVNPLLKAELQSDLRASEGLDAPSDQFYQSLQKFQQLKAGAGASALADAYYGDYAPKLERFLRMTEGAPDGSMDARAYRAAFDNSAVSKPRPLSHKEIAGLTKDVSSKTNSMIPRWLGGKVNLREDTLGHLARIAEVAVEDWRGVPGMTDAEAVGRGVASAISSRRVELLGGYAIDRADVDAKVPTLRELASGKVNVPEGSHDKYFESFLATRGLDGKGSVRMHFYGMVNGTQKYAATMYHDGETKVVTFNANEWQAFAEKATLTDTGKPEKSPWAFGPAITYRPDPGAPSIYADRAKWVQYRAQQEAASRKRLASTKPE